jgi:hypothetical protein
MMNPGSIAVVARPQGTKLVEPDVISVIYIVEILFILFGML